MVNVIIIVMVNSNSDGYPIGSTGQPNSDPGTFSSRQVAEKNSV